MQFVLKICFSPDVSQQANFIFYFFSSDEEEKYPVGPRRPNNILSVA